MLHLLSGTMRTIQVQKVKGKVRERKISSFIDIAPRWSKYIHQPKTQTMQFYDKTRNLDLSDFKCCVVGEAYGFSDKYTQRGTKDQCDSCYSQAINFANILMEGPKKRENMVNTFVNHWNLCHM